MPTGIDLRLMEVEDFRRTQLLRDGPAVEARSEEWRRKAARQGLGMSRTVAGVQGRMGLEERGMQSSDLVTVATFRSTSDAQVAKGVLDESGIESMVRSDNAGGMYPAIGGSDLLVRTEDVEKANEALHRRHRQSHGNTPA
jgi:putative signal transducing protein